MAYDERLAGRIRAILAGHPGYEEKKMFGGACFMVNGSMCVGVVKDDLMARVGHEQHAACSEELGASPMIFTGKPMDGYLYVSPEGVATDEALERWVLRCVRFVSTLPPKGPKKMKTPRR